MRAERRASVRSPLNLQVALQDGSTAVTRNICSEGLYMEVPGGGAVDPWVSFEFAVPAAGMAFRAVAQVLRTEALPGGGTGVAVRLHVPRLLPLN